MAYASVTVFDLDFQGNDSQWMLFDKLLSGGDGASGECRDLHDRVISPGIHYVPGPDTCTLCVCDNGQPKWCKAVLCSPPQVGLSVSLVLCTSSV